jgi:hypothetical protein
MKKLLTTFGIIAFVAVIVFSMAACDEVDNTDPKSITITGYTGNAGRATITVFSSYSVDGIVAKSNNVDTGSTFTIPLDNPTSNMGGQPTGLSGSWTGSGSYIIMLQVNYSNSADTYFYSNGKTREELGIPASSDMTSQFDKLPKYNINQAVSTIPFDKFIK